MPETITFWVRSTNGKSGEVEAPTSTEPGDIVDGQTVVFRRDPPNAAPILVVAPKSDGGEW